MGGAVSVGAKAWVAQEFSGGAVRKLGIKLLTLASAFLPDGKLLMINA